MFDNPNMDNTATSPSAGSPREFGILFRKEREALGLTLQEVATRVGCRRQTIGDLEAGNNVGMHTFFKALSVLGKRIEIRSNGLELDRLGDFLDEDWLNE